MTDQLDHTFLQHINLNLGIAHKVCRIYFQEPEERADILQEMMYQLWRSYPRFDGRSKFSTWMYSVCLNTALTYRRKIKKEKKESLSMGHHEIPDEAVHNTNDAITLMLDAVSTLSSLNKAIVLLYLEDMSYEEIATIIGISRSNVSVRLVRIKKELEIKLKQKIKSIDDVNT
jgi:RNA polymerase sigma factor (sigma-70 family)